MKILGFIGLGSQGAPPDRGRCCRRPLTVLADGPEPTIAAVRLLQE